VATAYYGMSPDHVFPYIYMPEPAIISGFNHIAMTFSAMLLFAKGGYKVGEAGFHDAGLVDSPGARIEAGAAFQSSGASLQQIVDISDDPLLAPFVQQVMGNDPGRSAKVHPRLAPLMEAHFGIQLAVQAVDPKARAAKVDPATGAVTQGKHYRLPPGGWSAFFDHGIIGEINQTLWQIDNAKTTQERGYYQSKLLRIARLSGLLVKDIKAPRHLRTKMAGYEEPRYRATSKTPPTPH